MGQACAYSIDESYCRNICERERQNSHTDNDSSLTIDMQKKGQYRKPVHRRNSSKMMRSGNPAVEAVAAVSTQTKVMNSLKEEISSQKKVDKLFTYFKEIDDLNINWMFEKKDGPSNSSSRANTMHTLEHTLVKANNTETQDGEL